jgi:hypothetical protein
MAPVCVSSYSWVIFLSLSHTNSMSHSYFPCSHPKSALIDRHTMFWSISQSSQCFQVICHASQCSREVSLQTNHSAVLPFSSCVSPYSFNLSSYITFLCQFHVDDGGYIMALLRRVCSCRLQHIIQELDLETKLVPWRPACLNGRFPHFRQ